jgi:ABC-type transport system involved in multi-copper enzyme maturation permease subunit
LRFIIGVWNVIQVTWKTKSIVFLVLGLCTLGPLVISLHAINRSGAERAQLLVFAPPKIENIAPVHHMLSPGYHVDRTSIHMEALFASSANARRGQALKTETLDDIYRFLLPLLMVLVGANVLPHDRKIYLSLGALPGGRALMFLFHVLALLCLIVLMVLALFLCNVIVLLLAHGTTTIASSMALLAEYHIALLLYSTGFAAMGFLLSSVIRNRSTSMIAAITIAILLVAVIPQFYLTASQTYFRSQSARIQQSGYEAVLKDPMMVAISLLARSPGYALAQALEFLPTLHTPVSEGGCIGCTTTQQQRSAANRARLSMGGFALLMILGSSLSLLRSAEGDA